jgi:hypothetical protein
MEDENEDKYLSKALQMLIQDLAEVIVHNDVGNPRNVKNLHDARCNKIAKKITSITAEPISSRSIRNFKNEETIGNTASRDLLAAAWFFLIKEIEKKNVNRIEGGTTDGYWDKYMDLFRRKKEEITNFLGKKEAVTHEFQERVASIEDLAMFICSFANKEGGYIIFGVGRDNKTLVGVNSNSPLVKNTLAALRRFGEIKPKIEFGWGYFLENEKTCFVIRVYKSNSGEIFRANGKIHIKNGSGYKTIDENERENESYSYEQATRSRRNLIENIRRIKSIVDDYLDYYDNYKERLTSDDEKRTFFLMSLNFISDTFITYLLSIWKEVSYKTISVDNLHLYSLVENDIDYSIKQLRKGKIDPFLNRIGTIPEIHSIIIRQIDVLKKLILNPVNEITSTEVYEAISLVSSLTRQIDLDTNHRFHLTQTQVRI